jgi:nucleoside-diphosphate-sugar epimerase
MRPLVIVGCGYLGMRVALAARTAGRTVYAVTRHRAEAFRAAGLIPIVADVLSPAALADVPAGATMLYAVGFDRAAGRPMREVYVQGLANVLATAAPPAHIIYASSTSVYGQTTGEWVDEDAITAPTEASGVIVHEAEQTLRGRRPDAVILRFAGLYGPGRVLRRAALLAGEPFAADPDKFLNLIHIADAAEAVRRAESAEAGTTFNVADGVPVTRRDFYTATAECLGAPPAAFTGGAGAPEPNRRVDAGRIRRVLGFRPQFADYRAGLADAVAG